MSIEPPLIFMLECWAGGSLRMSPSPVIETVCPEAFASIFVVK